MLVVLLASQLEVVKLVGSTVSEWDPSCARLLMGRILSTFDTGPVCNDSRPGCALRPGRPLARRGQGSPTSLALERGNPAGAASAPDRARLAPQVHKGTTLTI